MDRLHQRQKAQVKTQHLVFRVVGNPRDLVRVQAWVDGVQHPARATDAVIQLEVAVTIPRQRGNAVAEAEIQAVQRFGHLPRARGGIPVGVAMQIALHPARHDFCVAMVALRKLDQ